MTTFITNSAKFGNALSTRITLHEDAHMLVRRQMEI